MTPDLLRELSKYPMFPQTAATLIRVAGIDAAAALIKAWPGQEWPCPVSAQTRSRAGQRRIEQLQEIVGANATVAIVRHYGGGMLSVPNCKTVLHQHVQAQIRSAYDALLKQGYSSPEAVFELGITYQFNGRAIEKIIRRPDIELAPALGQGSLF